MKTAQTVTEQPTSKDNLWWRAQAVNVKDTGSCSRLYTLNDNNQPGCVTKVIEDGPENAPTYATIYTRQTPDTTETYIIEEAWDEELWHWDSYIYCPYTNQRFASTAEYFDWWASGGYKQSLSYNLHNDKVHDGWKHHPAVTAERTVKGTINHKSVVL